MENFNELRHETQSVAARGSGSNIGNYDVEFVLEKEMDVEDLNVARFIGTFNPNENGVQVLPIPEAVMLDPRFNISSKALMYFPDGRKINIMFRRRTKCLSNLALLAKECRLTGGRIVLVEYKGCGRFFVNIFCDLGAEVQYVIPTNPNSYNFWPQDTVRGIGCKFISVASEFSVSDGEFDIPEPFFRKFGKYIPPTIQISLKCGKLINGLYSSEKGMLFRLQELVRFAGIVLEDTLVFTYWGNVNFSVIVFDESKVEKGNAGASMNTEVHIGQSEVQVVEHVGDNNIAIANEANVVWAEEVDNHIGNNFTYVMKRSHVNRTGHGVYIPRHINPPNRNWILNETIILRTENGDWPVVITFSDYRPRCSAGWNKFAQDNHLIYNQILRFSMLPEEDNHVVFYIDIE